MLLLVVVIAVAVPAIVLVTKALTGTGTWQAVEGPTTAWRPLAARVTQRPAADLHQLLGGQGRARTGRRGRDASSWTACSVLEVDLEGGYYRPNRFTVRAGVPVKVVFTGWAEDCLGQPEFPELGLKGDLSSTGRAVFPLGVLDPGTYTFTCAMGVNEGRITVE